MVCDYGAKASTVGICQSLEHHPIIAMPWRFDDRMMLETTAVDQQA